MSIKRLSGAGLTTPKSNKLWDQTTFQSGMFALATIKLTSSQSSITFSDIPNNYTHLQIRGIIIASGATNPDWKFNGDSTVGNYFGHHFWGTNASAASNNQSGTCYWNYAPASTYPAPFIMDIFDANSLVKNKTMRCMAGYDGNGSTSEIALWSGVYKVSNTAVSSVTLNCGNGQTFSANSQFALYGIKVAS